MEKSPSLFGSVEQWYWLVSARTTQPFLRVFNERYRNFSQVPIADTCQRLVVCDKYRAWRLPNINRSEPVAHLLVPPPDTKRIVLAHAYNVDSSACTDILLSSSATHAGNGSGKEILQLLAFHHFVTFSLRRMHAGYDNSVSLRIGRV